MRAQTVGSRARRLDETGRGEVHQADDITRLAVAVYGTTQPEKLALLMRGPDDGLFCPPPLDVARPGPVPAQQAGTRCPICHQRSRSPARTRSATGRSALADDGAAERRGARDDRGFRP